MAEHALDRQPQRLPLARQGEADGEHRRLGDLRRAQGVGVGRVPRRRAGRQGTPDQRPQALREDVELAPEDAVRLVERAPHVRMLAALAGQQQGDGGRLRRHPAAGCVGRSFECRCRLAGVLRHHGAAMAQCRASGLQGEGDVSQIRVGPLAQPGRQMLRLALQRALRCGREHQRLRVRSGRDRSGVRDHRIGCGFEDDVGVGAADAEGADAGAQRPPARGPGPRLGRPPRRDRPRSRCADWPAGRAGWPAACRDPAPAPP